MFDLQALYQEWVTVFPEYPDAVQEMLAWLGWGPCVLVAPALSPFLVVSQLSQTLS